MIYCYLKAKQLAPFNSLENTDFSRLLNININVNQTDENYFNLNINEEDNLTLKY